MEQGHVLSAGPARRELTPPEIRAAFARHRAGRRFSDSAQDRVRGDHSQSPGAEPPGDLTKAAVLVALIERQAGLTVLLTLRMPHLAAHAGQVALPGGRLEPTDRDAEAGALREAAEEVGLAPELVEVIGRLDTYITGTGYEITPVVGLVRPPVPLQADPGEVAEIFEVPLSVIIDPANHLRRTRELRGKTRGFFLIPYQERNIWGATAGILVNLAEVLAS
jgi:8-oxo-dGTP pyrophosphatase MutT (NUDIX family)